MTAHLRPTTGGSQPAVGVVFQMTQAGLDAINFAGGGPRDAKWDAMFDNTYDFNQITEIPAGLGLDFAIDGSSSVITATEAGSWIFEWAPVFPLDASVEGHFGFANVDISDGYVGPGITNTREASPTYVAPLQLPIGATTAFRIALDGSADPYHPLSLQAAIVRVR